MLENIGHVNLSHLFCVLVNNHLIVSVMMAALWSLLNRMLSVFFPFLKVMMNSLFG